MIIRWDDVRIDRVLFKEYQKELEFNLKSKVKGFCDIKLFLNEFESQFAQYIGTEYAVALNSGTDAFELSLAVLGIGNGDSVILPNITYATIPLAIIQRKAQPILLDIKEDDLNMNEDLIEGKIRKNTKAVIASHMFGRPCNIEKILKIARKYNFYVIEDACQALGASYKKRKVGSFGELSIFSFHHKLLSSYEGVGGMLCFNNHRYKKILEDYTKNYFVSFLERNKRFMRMHFLDLITIKTQFKYLGFILKLKRKVKELYEEELGKIKEIKIFKDKIGITSTVNADFVIFAEERDSLNKWLFEKGIILLPWQYPCSVLHKMKSFEKYAISEYPVSEIYYKKVLFLPLFSFMKEEEAMYVIDLIKKFYKR